MNENTKNKILHETETGYDLVSQKFSETRKHFWRGLEYIKSYTKSGDRVLDFGCGNGRLLGLIGDEQNTAYYGVDVSEKLIEIARQKYLASKSNSAEIHFSKLDPIQTILPFDDNFFNSVYSIAVFHHFPSTKYREDIVKEIYRTTNDGGYIIITVWYLWQKKYLKNVLRNWKNKILKKSDLDWNDCYISFTNNRGESFQRFHHAFTKRELKRLFQQAGFEIEKCEIPDGRNIVLVGKKV